MSWEYMKLNDQARVDLYVLFTNLFLEITLPWCFLPVIYSSSTFVCYNEHNLGRHIMLNFYFLLVWGEGWGGERPNIFKEKNYLNVWSTVTCKILQVYTLSSFVFSHKIHTACRTSDFSLGFVYCTYSNTHHNLKSMCLFLERIWPPVKVSPLARTT